MASCLQFHCIELFVKLQIISLENAHECSEIVLCRGTASEFSFEAFVCLSF